jgi:RimJ/RimL family protein N-acetyltransferase
MRQYDKPNGYDVWMVIHRAEMRIIGDIGFKGPPDEEGSIEIGYGIIEAERRKGYCYEAVKSLVEWAFLQNEVNRIKADCLSDNIGSIRILQELGFEEINRDEQWIFWKLEKEGK